jgi:hypothetical protein
MKLQLVAKDPTASTEIDVLAVRVYDALVSVMALPTLLDSPSLVWLADRVRELRTDLKEEEEKDLLECVIRLIARHQSEAQG